MFFTGLRWYLTVIYKSHIYIQVVFRSCEVEDDYSKILSHDPILSLVCFQSVRNVTTTHLYTRGIHWFILLESDDYWYQFIYTIIVSQRFCSHSTILNYCHRYFLKDLQQSTRKFFFFKGCVSHRERLICLSFTVSPTSSTLCLLYQISPLLHFKSSVYYVQNSWRLWT